MALQQLWGYTVGKNEDGNVDYSYKTFLPCANREKAVWESYLS